MMGRPVQMHLKRSMKVGHHVWLAASRPLRSLFMRLEQETL